MILFQIYIFSQYYHILFGNIKQYSLKPIDFNLDVRYNKIDKDVNAYI